MHIESSSTLMVDIDRFKKMKKDETRALYQLRKKIEAISHKLTNARY